MSWLCTLIESGQIFPKELCVLLRYHNCMYVFLVSLILMPTFAQDCKDCSVSHVDIVEEVKNKIRESNIKTCKDFKIEFQKLSNLSREFFNPKPYYKVVADLEKIKQTSDYKKCVNPGLMQLFISDCKNAIEAFRKVLYFSKWPHEKLFEKAQDQEFETKIAANKCVGEAKTKNLAAIDNLWNMIIKKVKLVSEKISSYEYNNSEISYGLDRKEFINGYNNNILLLKKLCAEIKFLDNQ